MIAPPPALVVEEAVARALKEDLGDAGDITSAAVVPASRAARAVIAARKAGVIAGTDLARAAFRHVDPMLSVRVEKGDGARIGVGETDRKSVV